MKLDYEAVIGLEVHAELRTATKIFCACSTRFGAAPNTQVCPVCLGLPGALPVLNRRVVELAATAGLALHCAVDGITRTDRKQYFYPDLPKGYQISQDAHPLCRNGHLSFRVGEQMRNVRIARIHIEEDAGKLIHEGAHTLVDCNRCGVPLIEIVTMPDLRSAAEAGAYLRELRAVLLACGVSDCRMQEGSLRCDVNVSVRRAGESRFGTRVEIKNLNSFTFVEKAIAYETERQIALLEKGAPVLAETRRYDESSGGTVRMRLKETAEDYRYLQEPDLLPFALSEEEIAALAEALPELPAAQRERLARQYGISPADAATLTAERALADYFEAAAAHTAHPSVALHLLLSELLRVCKSDPFHAPLSAVRLGEVAELLGSQTVNATTAKKLLQRLYSADFSPAETVAREGLAQVRDPERLRVWIEEALQALPRAVADYKNGKHAALRALQGRVMAASAGRADPTLCEALLLQALQQTEG